MALQKGPLAIAGGDFNGDGHPDFAVADSSAAEASVFLGAGDGTFKAVTPASLPSDCGAAYLVSGPFTAKGNVDLLAVCALGNLVVLPNTGGGTFGKPVQTILPSAAWVGNLVIGQLSPAIADFNGDGYLDLIIGTVNIQGGPVAWYYLPGKGGGTFGPPVSLNLGGLLPLSLVAGDFNGDGIPDLVAAQLVGTTAPSVQLLFGAGKGDGTFAAFTETTLPVTAGTMLLPADVNGDGKLDLVITGSSTVEALLSLSSTGASAVDVYLGDGKGNFPTHSFTTNEPVFMGGAVLGNFLGTGNLDLVATTIDGNFLFGAIAIGGLQLFPGIGDGTFGKAIAIPSSSNTIPTGVVAADFNGDGRLDLALSTLPGSNIGNIGSVGLGSDFSALIAKVLAVLPNGNAEVLLNTATFAALTFSDANGASFANGPQAAGSIVSAFGTGLAGTTAGASTVPLPTTLGGVFIDVKDSAGVTQPAPLFYVSPKQINYAIPASTATGPATITITSAGSVFTAAQRIVSVAPGVFSANGLAAGTAVKTVNGAQQVTTLVNNGAPVPIDVSGGGTFLVLYGTGIRNHRDPVTAQVGTESGLPTAYAGAQGVYVGEDQINIQLPASLKGAGVVNVTLTVDGQTSDPVRVSVQ